jgi:cell division protein FtsQ
MRLDGGARRMPRLTATRDAAPSRPEAVRRPLPRARAKKPVVQQDRLTARTLFMRRVKRSLKPGIWFLGIMCVVVLVSEAFREIPTVGPVISPAGTMRHGFASVAAALGFRISKIEILGADTTPLPVVQQALGVNAGDPSLGFSLDQAAARIEQLGPVQTAIVERALPGTIIVTIKERAPYAIWQTADAKGATKFVLIDKAGDLIANQDAAAAKRRNPALLLFVGQDAPQNATALMGELEAEKPVLMRVAAAERIDGLRWNLTLKDQAVVKLPADDEQAALAQLADLQNSMGLLDRPVEWIDLRDSRRLVVHPYPAAPGHT